MLPAAPGLMRAESIGACGRYFTTESRATPIVLRENDFLPCPGRACGRLIRLRNNEPRCLYVVRPGIRAYRSCPEDYCPARLLCRRGAGASSRSFRSSASNPPAAVNFQLTFRRAFFLPSPVVLMYYRLGNNTLCES